MLARIPKLKVSFLLLAATGTLLGACETQRRGALVDDPDGRRRESQLPWNKQEKWETEGQFAGLNDAVNRR